MEKMLVRGVAKDTNVARISIVGLPDTPGVAFRLFEGLAKKRVNIDIILQSVGRDGTKDITFTVAKDQANDAIDAVNELHEGKVACAENVATVSVVGAGMATHPGVASKMFEALYDCGINIQMIATSEIKISVIIDVEDCQKGMQAVHDKFIG